MHTRTFIYRMFHRRLVHPAPVPRDHELSTQHRVHCWGCWSIRPTVCCPKEAHVRVSDSRACYWVRSFAHAPVSNHGPMLQSRRGSGYSCHRGHRLAERREILPHRGDFWHYAPACQRHLHTVSHPEISSTQYLTVKHQVSDRVPTHPL